MGIIGCFDELHVHPHRVGALLHTPLEKIGHTQLFSDGRQVFRLALVMLDRSARDHFQVGDL